MSKKTIYHFEDISILVNTQNDKLCRYIDEYCHLTRSETELEKRIIFTYREESPDRINECDVVPDDAHLDLDVPFDLEGVSRLKCFSRTDAEAWYTYEGYGYIYNNYVTKEITAILTKAVGLDIAGFIILFLYPMIRALGGYGYHRLHAACLKVRERNILVTGLSDRGKSTATFALLKRGHQVLSDEMPLLKRTENGFQVYALFNMVKLRQTALDKFFSGFDRICFLKGEDCYIKLSDLSQTVLKKVEGIHQLFILEQTGRVETNIEPVGCLEVVPEMFPTSLNILRDQQSEKDFQTLMELLNVVDCYKVFFGVDMAKFAEQIENKTASSSK